MANIRISKTLIFLVITLMLIGLVCGVVFYKPPVRTITVSELDAIHGVKIGGVVMNDIQDYIRQNPNCTVEDLRVIPRVDDMIIDQLERKFR